MERIFTKIFYESFKRIKGRTPKYIENDSLEEALSDYIKSVIGFRFNMNYNLGEVKYYIDNLVYNMHFYDDIYKEIENYKNKYLQMLDSNHYVKLLIETLQRMFSHEYDGKLGVKKEYNSENDDYIIIVNKGESLFIGTAQRKDDILLPAQIMDVRHLNDYIKSFLELLKTNDSLYNLFKNPGFSTYSDDEIIRTIMEGLLLNSTYYELANIELLFQRYGNFLIDDTLQNMSNLTKLGDVFNDELYMKSVSCDLEYETPYSLIYMLKNRRAVLPNVRLGIETVHNKKVAHIISTQTSQTYGRNVDLSEDIKKNIPNTSKYNFFNPDHFISLVITLGVLNGQGIDEFHVARYMPLRYNKTIRDKNMNEEEAHNYLMRITDKPIYTYLKLSLLGEGLDVLNYPESGINMRMKSNGKIIWANDFLQNLYDMGYEYGKLLIESKGERVL